MEPAPYTFGEGNYAAWAGHVGHRRRTKHAARRTQRRLRTNKEEDPEQHRRLCEKYVLDADGDIFVPIVKA